MKKNVILQLVVITLLIALGSMDHFLWQAKTQRSEVQAVPRSSREWTQVAQLLSFWHANNDAVWPGLRLDDAPTVLSFESGRLYGIGVDPSSPWKKLTIGNSELLETEQDKWGILKVKLHPGFEMDGQSVFVFQMTHDPSSPQIFVHERFHRYQFEHFKPVQMVGKGYEDHLNAENLSLLRLEDQLLIEFLQTTDYGTRLELLKDFCAVTAARKQQISLASLAWEDNQQKMEGLADYVAAKMFTGERSVLRAFTGRDSEEDFIDYAVKWRHYSVGATLAFALDFLAVEHWKVQIEGGANLRALLENALPLPAEEMADRLQAVKMHSGYELLLQRTQDKVQEFQDNLKALVDQYDNQEGALIRLGNPRGLGISGGGSSEKLYYLADGTTMSIVDRSFSSTVDSAWKLATKQIPFLIQRQGFREFKVEKELRINLNNRYVTLEELLNKPGEYPFDTLAWEGRSLNFSSERHNGVIISDGKTLSIAYRNPYPS